MVTETDQFVQCYDKFRVLGSRESPGIQYLNTLWMGDTDMHLYITTVQDG